MLLYFLITYLIFGILLNYAISELDKIQTYNEDADSDEDVSQHLIILLWPILFCGICYILLKEILKQQS